MRDLEKLRHLRMGDHIAWQRGDVEHTDVLEGWRTVLHDGRDEPVAVTSADTCVPLRFIVSRARPGERLPLDLA